VGWYMLLLVLDLYKVLLWTGTRCCWQYDGTDWRCGLVQSVACSRIALSGIVVREISVGFKTVWSSVCYSAEIEA